MVAYPNASASKTILLIASGVVLGVALGVVLGGFAVSTFLDTTGPTWMSEIPIHAVASSSDDGFAVATGPLDDEIEGLFMLDTLTGELSCRVMNQRAYKFGVLFTANAAVDMNLEQGKRPKYLLVTGRANFRGAGGGGVRPARSVAYVVETNTGYYAAYGVPWRKTMANEPQLQPGRLALLDIGQSRTAAIRDTGE